MNVVGQKLLMRFKDCGMKNIHPSTRLWLYIVQYPSHEVRDFREGTCLNWARGAVAFAVR